jgi:hypothetical protein
VVAARLLRRAARAAGQVVRSVLAVVGRGMRRFGRALARLLRAGWAAAVRLVRPVRRLVGRIGRALGSAVRTVGSALARAGSLLLRPVRVAARYVRAAGRAVVRPLRRLGAATWSGARQARAEARRIRRQVQARFRRRR